MVLNHIYSRKNERGGIEYFWPEQVENLTDDKGAIVGARLKSDGSTIDYGGIGTMSKSKNNGVDPQSLIDGLGADTARLFVMFASPPEQTLEWSDSGVEGAHRFLRRLWTFCQTQQDTLRSHLTPPTNWDALDEAAATLRRSIHGLLKQADYDYQRIQYNTVVSTTMKMLNTLEAAAQAGVGGAALSEATSILLRVLYPVVPHITWQLWRDLGYADIHGDLLDAPWPVVDDAALRADTIELVLQINGKVRGHISIPQDADKPVIEALAQAHEAVSRFLEGRAPKRIVVVPGRLVNVVG
ncbi:MAG: class I tRNA ligase family protein, partial [Castellaniella sp.]|nr:class I tRNA ligase family protein [Castellaniella sp.]